MVNFASTVKKINKTFGILGILASIGFTSCELGLGSAVNVLKPEFTIGTPAANDIIYGEFTLSGVWYDDHGELTSVSVELVKAKSTQSEAEVKFGPFEGTFSKEIVKKESDKDWRPWQCVIDPVKEGIPDGKYSAVITVKDKSPAENEAPLSEELSVSFVLDNTAPLVILDRPATKAGSASSDMYGCEFALSGEAVDDNIITLIEVEVYDAETDELKKVIPLENVAKKIERNVAVYGDEDKAYESIYGEIKDLSEATKKEFYCKVIAYDEARRVPYVDGDKGNRTELFYLESEISKYKKEFKSSGLYEILKGTYDTSSLTEAQKESLAETKNLLENNGVEKASFSLDPRNNPKYTVSTRSNMAELSGDLLTEAAKLSNNSSLTVNFLPGLDEYYIVKDSIGVSIIECDEKGNIKSDAEKIVLFAPFKEGDDAEAREDLIKTTGSTYSVNVKIGTKTNPEIQTNRFYKFVVEGRDENKNRVFNYANTDYAFKLVSVNSKPSVEITSLEKKSSAGEIQTEDSTTYALLNADQTLVIHGNAKLDDLIPNMKFSIGLTNNLDSGLGTCTATEFAENGFECIIPESFRNKKFTIRVEAINPEEEDQTTSENISVTYDCGEPVFAENVTVSPTITKDEKTFVNGTVNIKTSVSDKMNVVSKVEYTVTGADGKESQRKSVENISGDGFDIKTTDFEDGLLTVKLYATDEAGNETKGDSIKTVVLNIDQSTDKPVIEINNADVTIKKTEDVNAATKDEKVNNIFGTVTNTNLIFSLSDDDGMSSAKIFISPVGENKWKILKEYSEDELNGTKSKSDSVKISSSEGTFDIKVEVQDVAEETDFSKSELSPFMVVVDNGAPNFTLTSTTDALHAANTDIPVTGKVSDGAAFSIKRFKDAACTIPDTNNLETGDAVDTIIVSDDGSWSDTIKKEIVLEEGRTVYYKAEDVYGQSTVVSFKYRIDAREPGFSLTRVGNNLFASDELKNDEPKVLYVKKSENLTIAGEVWDEGNTEERSGLVDYVYYKFVKDGDPVPSVLNESEWNQSDKLLTTGNETEERGNWSKSVDLSKKNGNVEEFADGEKYTLYIFAKDNSRNISTSESNPTSAVVIYPDGKNPVISNVKVIIEDEETRQVKTVTKNSDIKIEADVTDAETGLNRIFLFEDYSEISADDYSISGPDRNGRCTIILNAAKLDQAKKSHNLYVKAYDKAGNETTSAAIVIDVDVKNPETKINGISPVIDSSKVNGTITVTGYVTDDIGLSKVELFVTGKNETRGAAVQTINAATTYSNYEFEIDTTELEDTTEYEICVIATDEAGNISGEAVKQVYVDQKTDAPVITLTNADMTLKSIDEITEATKEKRTNNIFGTISNTLILGTIEDDDGLEEIKIEYKKLGESTWHELKTISSDVLNGTTTKTISEKVPGTEGTYFLKFSAKDTEGKTVYSELIKDEFIVAVDNGAPNFVISTDSGALQAANTDITVKGKVSDGAAFTIKRYQDAACTIPDSNNKENFEAVDTISVTADGSWSDTIKKEIVLEEGRLIYYKAEDIFGQSTIVSFEYLIDAKAPGFNITRIGKKDFTVPLAGQVNVSDDTTLYVKASETLTITGQVWDEGEGRSRSGLQDYVFYKLVKEGESEPEKNSRGTAYLAADWEQTNKLTTTSNDLRQEGIWTKTLDISSGYEDGKKYTLYIAGKDNARNVSEISANPCAAVVIVPDSLGPVIEDQASDITQVTLANNTSDIFITAKIRDEVSGISKIELYENGVKTSYVKQNSDITHSGENYTIKISAADLTNGGHSIVIRATDVAGNISESQPVVINADIQAPVVDYVSGVTPTISQNNTEYVNGIVTVTGLARDETALEKIYWYVDDESSATADTKGVYTCSENEKLQKTFSFKIDTRKLSDGIHKVYIYSEDKSGNQSSRTSSYSEFHVLQSTDIPVISLTSLNNSKPAESEISSDNNVLTSDGKISGLVTDDDEISKVSFFVDDAETPVKVITEFGSNKKEYKFDIQLSSLGITTLGTHNIKIEAEDNAGGYTEFNGSAYSKSGSASNKIYFGVDNGAPDIIAFTVQEGMNKHLSNSVYYMNESFEVTAVVKDDVSLKSVSVVNGTTTTAVTEDDSQQTFVFAVSPQVANTSEAVEGKLSVTDRFLQTNTRTLKFVFDFEKPEVDAAANWNYEPALKNGKFFKAENTLTITGHSKENDTTGIELRSGLKSAQYKLDSNSWTAVTTFDESSGDWTVKLDANTVSEGEHTISVRVLDLAGNVSDEVTDTITCDETAPKIVTTLSNTVYSDDITIKGRIEETYLLNLESKLEKYNAAEAEYETVTVADAGFDTSSGLWTFTMSKGTDSANDGRYRLSLNAEDKAGHKATPEVLNFLLDTKAPEVVITTPETDTKNVNQTAISAPSTQFAGTASDVNSIKDVYYKLSAYDSADTENYGKLVSAGNGWNKANLASTSWNVWESFEAGVSEGKYWLNVYAVDEVGNKSAPVSRRFDVDMAAPAVTISSSAAKTNTEFTLSGTVTETNGLLSDTVVIKVTKDGAAAGSVSASLTQDAADPSKYTFTKTIVLATDGTEDGSYVYEAEVTDNAQKTGKSVATVLYDTKAPETFSVDSPNNTGKNSVSALNQNVSVSGKLNDSGSGAVAVWYKVLPKNETAPTERDGVTGSWTKLSATGNWIFDTQFAAEGSYIIYAYAEDAVGNKTAIISKLVDVDVSAPSVKTLVVSGEVSEVLTTTAVKTKAADYSFRFEIEDSLALNSVPYTLAVTRSGTELSASDYTVTEDSGNAANQKKKIYTVTVNAPAADGDYGYTVTAKDSMGKETPVTRTIRLDKTGPELSVTSPAFADGGIGIAGVFEWQNKKAVKISGTAEDVSGIKKIYVKSGDVAEVPAAFDSSWKDIGSATSWSYTTPSSISDGETKLNFVAVDGNGTKSALCTYIMQIDTEAPVSTGLKLTKGNSGSSVNIAKGESYYVNKNDSEYSAGKYKFKVEGQVSDNISLKTLKVTAKKGSDTKVLIDYPSVASTEKANVTRKTVGSDKAWNWSYTVDSVTDSDFTNGEWTFDVSVTEEAELHEASSEWTIIYDVEAPSVSNITGSDGNPVKECYDALKTIAVKGSAADGDSSQSGLDSVMFAVAKGTGDSYPASLTSSNTFKDWTETSGSAAEWVAKLDASEITAEGKYAFFIKAKDKAGNESISAPVNFIADTTAPEYTVENVKQYYGNDVVISGTHTDTYFASMEVSVKKGNTDYTSFTKTAPVSGSSKAWSVTLPADSSAAHSKDGKYEVSIKFTDKSGKSVSVPKITTTIDTKIPEVKTIDTVSSDGSTIISVEDFKFSGTAEDETGLSEIKYLISSTGTASASDAGWISANGTSAWNFYETFVSGKTGRNCEGEYYLHVYAADNAGNKSPVLSRKFQVDFEKPVIGINALSASTKDHFALSGTASDSRGLKKNAAGKTLIKVVQKNPAWQEETMYFEVASDGTWTTDSNLPVLTGAETSLIEGLYSYTVSIEDEVGKVSTETSSQIRWDISAPALTVTSHSFDSVTKESTWLTNNAVTLSGITQDATGIEKTLFKLGDGVYTELEDKANWTVSLADLPQGKNTVWFKTTDTNGTTAEYKFVLKVDSDEPVMGLNKIARGSTSAAEILDNGTSVYVNRLDSEVSGSHKFTLSGSATDSYKLGTIVVKASKGDTTKTLIEKTAATGSETDSAWAWSVVVPLDSTTTGYLENGEWNFTVQVNDLAGVHPVTESFKVVIDTVLPQMNPSYSVASSATVRNVKNVVITPAASDTSGSGLDSVSYVICSAEKTEAMLSGSGTGAVPSNEWETISGANRDTSVTKNISFADGDNYLYLRAIDKAGNVKYSSAYRAKVDTEAPTIVMGNPGAVSCVNGSNDINVADFEIDVRDERGTLKSGIKQVDVYIDSIADGNLIASSVGASPSLTVSDTGRVSGSVAKEKFAGKNSAFKIFVQVTDNAGNISYTNTNIGIDKTNPNVTIKTTAKNNIGNKNLTVEGTSYDLNGVASVTLEYQTGASAWKAVTDSDADGFALVNQGTTSAWSYVIPTYDAETHATTTKLAYDADPVADGFQVKFRVTAVDVALNRSQEEITVTIDQDYDRPVITFTNLSSSGQIIQTPVIQGNVSDDDTWNNSKCVLKIDSENHTAAEWRTLAQKGTFTIDDNGIFSYKPEDFSDGEKQMFFYVKDAAGTEFITASGNVMDQSKVIYKGETSAVNNDSVISYISDTESPVIKALSIGDDSMTESVVVGGSAKSTVTVGMTVLDSNGVASATAVINGTKYNLAKTETTIAASETFANLASSTKEEVTMAAGSKKAEFVSSAIDVSSWSSGQITVSFDVVDHSGLTARATGYFTVDNQGPECEITNVADWSEEKTGAISWSFKFKDYPNTNAGFKKYAYLVLNDSYMTGTVADEAKILAQLRTNAVSIAANGTTVENLSLAGLPVVAQADESSVFKKISTIRTDVYNLPVYFYSVDALGNETLQSFTLLYNLFGGRPSATIAYPAGTQTEPQSMNGTIRMSGGAAAGTAAGSAAVEKVYVQFDVTQGSDFSATDLSKVAAYTISGSSNKVYTNIETGSDVTVRNGNEINWAGLDADGGQAAFWGIPVNNTTSWYKTINENLEFQNSDTDIKVAGVSSGLYRVAVRAVALASDGTFGSWSPVQYFNIDTNIPVINQDPAVISISGSGSQNYIQDMYVKGDATLKVAVADKDSIAKVMYYTASTQGGLNDASEATITTLDLSNPSSAVAKAWAEKGLNGYVVSIPLPSPSENKKDIYIKVVASKANESSAYATYHINFDNKAPLIRKLQFNSADWENADESTHRIVNSNGKFTLGGTAVDEASGYDKVGFYFIRGNVEDVSKYRARIYDPMSNNHEILVKAKDAASLSVAEKEFGITDASLGSSPQKMYGAEYTDAQIREATVAGEKRSQITLTSVDENIRKSGYVLVDGNFYQIDTVDSVNKKITLTENVSVINGTGSKTETVFFPYMLFVENTGSEKTDENGLTFTTYPDSDDGDGMPESIIKSQSSYAWDASVQSANIPDGPGTMVVFVWDKAGNVSASSYACSVQNNAPRLAKLHLGTDLDGSGTYDDEEFKTYDILGKTGVEQSSYVLNTEDYLRTTFKVKNGLALVTEFTGGNLDVTTDPGATIKAMFKNNASSTDVKCTKSTAADQADLTSPSPASLLEAGDIKSALTAPGSNMYAYNFGKNVLGADSTSASDEKCMSWTFWDVTSDTIQGVDSSYMYLRIDDLIIDQTDIQKPTVEIDPFFWNSKEDCSVPTDTNDVVLGHIDFKANPAAADKPGVSGEVYIEGTSKDNTRLKKLYMKTPHTPVAADAEASEVPATDTRQVALFESGVWYTAKRVSGVIKYFEGVGEDAVETAETLSFADDWPVNWKGFEIKTTKKPSQEGHEAEWRFQIDMTPYGIDSGKTVDAIAEDASEAPADAGSGRAAGPYKSEASNTQTLSANKTSHYIMDFVPYIKGITGVKRSRLGRYPVQAGATIRIEGMNFSASSTYTVNYKKTNGDVASAVANANVRKVSDGVIEVTAPDYSAFLEVVVDGVATQNNTNQNTKWNIEEGNWKKGDLKAGANYWTDDRYLSVWNVNTTFDGSINAHRGTIKKIQQKDTGSGTGKHVRNEPVADTLGGGAIYKQPGGNTQVDTLTNQTGHYYAAYSSDDLKVYGHVSTKTYSGHGDNVMYNSSEAAFQTPADEFDYTIVAGMPYYVVQDSWISGDSANVWGTGLYISKEGAWWDRSYNAKFGQDIGEKEEYYIIERQGASGSKAAARDSSSGYDEVLKQFKNPKIAGWYNPEESLQYTTADSNQNVKGVDYLYVSYYDSYAKCLKYASYKIGHRFDENGHAANFNWQHWGSHTEKSDIVPLMHTAPNKAYAATGVAESDNMKTGNAVVAGWDTLQTNPTSFKEKAGEWSDVMVDPSDHFPVIIYYNETKRCLEVAHGNSYAPVSGNICNTSGKASADKTESEWTKTKNITPDANIDFGRYVSAEIDANGNIHAAAQDVSNGKLYYIFLKKSGSTYSASYILVDGTSSVGMWTDIQLNNDVSANKNWYEYEPVISYLDKSFLNTQQAAKVAYVIKNGADSCFDAMTDPAKYSANDQKTSVMSSVYENGTKRTAKVAIGYNSDMLALDFLRDEE